MEDQFQVTIKPVKPDLKKQVIEKTLFFIGHNERQKAQEFVDSGGVVLEHLNEETAKNMAFQLMEEGVGVRVSINF